MLKVNKITFNNSGNKILYNYTYDKSISKYFNSKEPFFVSYDIDVREVPESIAIIPLLANIAPIAWFAGFSIELNEVDEKFIQALEIIKSEFEASYPNIDFSHSKIYVNKIVKNDYIVSKSAMLFSGGVDAYATYFRHYKEYLDLITIQGADVEMDDKKQWSRVVSLNEKETLLESNSKYYIKSNLRTFYTYQVDLLLSNLSWWGSVQHGLALNCVIAPLAVIRKYNNIYIASSYTDKIDISWGSTPSIDNNIKWGNTKIKHDGYELKRQDKVDLIIRNTKELNKTLNLRVCYSLLNVSVNCSKCEKCYRTMVGIILANANPNKYGFKAFFSIYDELLNNFKKGFSTKGSQYFWGEIYDKINEEKSKFIFKDKEVEERGMIELRNLIKQNFSVVISEKSKFTIIKYKIQNSFPKLFKFYLKIRQRNL